MQLDPKAIISQFDSLLGKYQSLRARSKWDDLSDLPRDETTELFMLLLAAIDRLSPPGSTYAKNATKYGNTSTHSNVCTLLAPLIGIIKALRSDYEAATFSR